MTGAERASRYLLHAGGEQLRAAGIRHARHEAEWLLSHLVNLAPLEVYLHDAPVREETVRRFWSGIEARVAGLPLQYLIGETDFLGISISVAPGVSIPRSETEAVVEQAIQVLRARQAEGRYPLRLLDLGIGSGCIAIALARAFPACTIVGVELSWKALLVARDNVLRQGVASQVRLVQGDWCDALDGEFDGIIANPPYVPSAQVDRLPLEVRQEPRESLDGGRDGMDHLRRLMAQVPRVLRPGGIVVLECAEEHPARLIAMAATMSWVARIVAFEDLAKRPRGVVIHAGEGRGAHDG